MKKDNFRFWHKISKTWMSNFSANILGVIVGIALTFGISNYVQYRNDQKELREMMSLIKRELDDNKKWMEGITQYYLEDFNTYRIILDNMWDKIPKDTIDKVVYQLLHIQFAYTSSNVWNVFQNSGMAHKLHNVELVSRISESYYWIETSNTFRQEYLKKREVLENVYEAEFDKQPYKYLKALLNNKESKRFLEEIVKFKYYNFSEFSEQLMPVIDHALYSVDNYDNPKKLDIDFEAFCEMQKEN
ncbi:hypothetical protein AGMMS50239_02810 [Bacteroidia bacterium]|nr:hypothetical protein AGMMS50239_02810 [Bacteroidia bacterium]